MGIYLTQRQHLPLKRAAELLCDVLGAAVSTGFLVAVAERAATLLAPFIGRAKELLAENPVIHADETSIRCPPRRGGCTSWPAPG